MRSNGGKSRLVNQGLAHERDGRILFQRNLLRELRRREVTSVAKQLTQELGKPFSELVDGKRMAGTYIRPIRLASGKFALIENSREFTLVPWRPTVERHRGKNLSAVMRGSSVSFDFTKKRGIGMG